MEVENSLKKFFFFRCYGVGLQVDKSNASLWHDLGINIFLQGYNKFAMSKKSKLYPDEDKKEIQIFPTDVTQRAMAAIKKSISLDSSDYNAWNSLGVLAYFHGKFRPYFTWVKLFVPTYM